MGFTVGPFTGAFDLISVTDGKTNGMAVGTTVGIFDGNVVGEFEGSEDGKIEGELLGKFVEIGAAEVASVGADVTGAAEVSIGMEDVAIVGEVDGACEGDRVGNEDGNTEGTLVIFEVVTLGSSVCKSTAHARCRKQTIALNTIIRVILVTSSVQ